ncbi:MAG TPA: NYN domain-containing protein [Candidatus Nanoarchaeia archaeon]|nr:NYN domain-containing protein [Candidatus Nanoarchaeia archaeon]
MSSQMHKAQRIGVFVDVQNLYYSAKNLYNSKVNFKEVLKDAVKGRTLIRAIAYVIRADIREEKNFFDALKNIGFEVKAKDLQIFYGGAKKGDWDIGIAMDCIELAPRLDTIVIVSGDGDFVPLVQHLKRALGCRVEVSAFGKSSSSKLVEESDFFTDLDKSRKYLIELRREEKKDGKEGANEIRKEEKKEERKEEKNKADEIKAEKNQASG